MRQELSAVFTLMLLQNHTKRTSKRRVHISVWSFLKNASPSFAKEEVTRLVRGPVGWKWYLTEAELSQRKKTIPKSQWITQNVLKDTSLSSWGRQLVYVMWVLFSSSEDQAVGARCSHQEPSRMGTLWGMALWSSACSFWSPGGIEGPPVFMCACWSIIWLCSLSSSQRQFKSYRANKRFPLFC